MTVPISVEDLAQTGTGEDQQPYGGRGVWSDSSDTVLRFGASWMRALATDPARFSLTDRFTKV